MVISYTKVFMNFVLLVLFVGFVSPDMLIYKRRRLLSLPTNCLHAVRIAGSKAKSGIYQIRLPLEGWTNRPFYVYCLLDHNGGDPWMLIQRRQDAEMDFYRSWIDYKTGFGNLDGSFFIGLDKLHAITQVQLHELKIELHDFCDIVKYANYESFAVGDESEQYELKIVGPYSGDAGDSFQSYHSGQKFSTYDQDNDNAPNNCAVRYKGAWWYNNCHESNLNGEYYNDTKVNEGKGIEWSAWHGYYYSLKYAQMAIRPRRSARRGMPRHGNEAYKCSKKWNISIKPGCKKRTKNARKCKKKAHKCKKKTENARKCKKKTPKE